MLKTCGVCFNSMNSVVLVVGEGYQTDEDEKVLLYNDEDFGVVEVSGLQGVVINYLERDDVSTVESLASSLTNGAFSLRAKAVILVKHNGTTKYLVALDDIQNDTWVITDGPGLSTRPITVTTFTTECGDYDVIEELFTLTDEGGF